MTFQIFQYDKLLDRNYRAVLTSIGGSIIFLVAYLTGYSIFFLLVMPLMIFNVIPWTNRENVGVIKLNSDAIIINDIKIAFKEIKFIKINYQGYDGKVYLSWVIAEGLNKIKIITENTEYIYFFLSTNNDTEFFKSYRKLLKENNVPSKVRTPLMWILDPYIPK